MIELQEVGMSYSGDGLLSDINLVLEPGAFYFLTGPSGSGKSTFLKLCYLELMPTYGKVQLFGRDSRGMSRDDIAVARRRIGVVHQDCRFLDHLSMAENILLPLTVSGNETLQDQNNLKDLLSWVGLARQANSLPPQLSGGERQRAALARAIISSPEVILADEPTGNVDWEMSKRLIALLVELNRMGKTVLMATHDLNIIRQTKSQVQARVLRIRNGSVALAGADL